MLDDLLNQVLTLWPAQPAPSHMEQEVLEEVDHLPLRSDFSGMATYQRLEVMSLTGHPHSIANSKTPISWQLPLPYDLVFDIIHTYLLDMLPTLRSLHGTCRSLTALCRPLCFKDITITTMTEATESSAFEKFATLLSDAPEIIDYIQTLRILDRGWLLHSAKAMSDEEEFLCYILTRRYPNLKQMEVSFHARWVLLPVQLQYAFELAFALPSLQVISLEHVQIPADLLSHLHSIPSIEVRCEVFPPCDNVDDQTMQCTPKKFKYYDPRQSEDGFNNMFVADSALVSKLEDLEIYATARQLRLFQAHFQNCYQTLTTLKIYPFHEPSNVVGNAPFSLNLESLARLKSLVLYADISGARSVVPARDAFWWMLNTLRTCHQPSLIDNVELVIQVEDLANTGKRPWSEVESVFRPRVGWRLLKELHIHHVHNKWRYGEMWNVEGYAASVILPQMPVLASMISVQFSISDCIPIYHQEDDMYYSYR